MCWSAKLIKFLGYNNVDYEFRVTVVDLDCTNVGKFILKSRFRTDDWSYVDQSRNQIDLPFHEAKRILANVLVSESRLSVIRCNTFVIILFYEDVKKGQSLIAFLFKSKTKR